MNLQREINKLETEIENILKTAKQEAYDELLKKFINAYPRLDQHPEQRLMLETMIDLKMRVEHDLKPKIDELKDVKPAEYRRYFSLLLKVEQQVDRLMSKLGFTFTAQPWIPVEQRKTFNPKSVVQIREKVDQIIENVTEETDETQKKKKKAKETEVTQSS